MGQIAATVGCGGYSCTLSACWEEVKVGQACRQAALSHDGSGEVDRDLCESLDQVVSTLSTGGSGAEDKTYTQGLFGKIDKLDIQELLA